MNISLDTFFVTSQEMQKYSEAYPGVDLVTEFRKMQLWLDANPLRKKKNVPRFICNWLSRAHTRLLEAEVAVMVREDIRRSRVPI